VSLTNDEITINNIKNHHT